MYNYGIIDGNLFLRRNFSAAKYSKTLLKNSYTGLCASFLSTVFNYQRNFELENVIIAWDMLPYKKLADITEYKQDRHYATAEDVERLNSLIAEASEKDLDELIKERDKIKYDLDCESIFHHAKNSLLANLDGLHIKNIRIVGYEADDLAYLSSRYLSSQGNSCLLISVDSDWITFVDDNVSFYRETLSKGKRAAQLYTKDTVPDLADAQELGCTLYEIGNLKEVYTGGHNNVSGFKHSKKKIPFKTFAQAILTENQELPEYEYFKKRVNALNINKYDNSDVLDSVKALTNSPTEDVKFRDYLRNLSPMLLSKYQSFGGPELVGGFVFA